MKENINKPTFVSILSIQSRTKSGWPDRISSSDDESYKITFASIWHSGKIDWKCFLRHRAFGVPTSSLVATACLFNEETVTFNIISRYQIFGNIDDISCMKLIY